MITILLVRTHSPGNLGACARTAANFGAALALADLRCDPSHPDAAAFASGAESSLARAARFASVEEAAAGYDLLIALSSERGRRQATLPPRITPPAIRRAVGDGRRVLLVFGPERSGLTTDEFLRCDARWSLPTEPSFPTLNLAQAVGVSLALLRGRVARKTAANAPDTPARTETRRRLESEVRSVLEARFPARRARPDVVDELVSFLRRAKPSEREAGLLRAALAGTKKR